MKEGDRVILIETDGTPDKRYIGRTAIIERIYNKTIRGTSDEAWHVKFDDNEVSSAFYAKNLRLLKITNWKVRIQNGGN